MTGVEAGVVRAGVASAEAAPAPAPPKTLSKSDEEVEEVALDEA